MCYSVLHTEMLVVLLLDLLTLSYTVKDLLKDTGVLCWWWMAANDRAFWNILSYLQQGVPIFAQLSSPYENKIVSR